MSKFDRFYRSTVYLKFFGKGWGNPDILLRLIENVNHLKNRDQFQLLSHLEPNIFIDKRVESKAVVQLEGSFISPFDRMNPISLVDENKVSRFQMIIPKNWMTKYKPVCIQFAGTGDHSYHRRRFFLANQLIDDGIASIIIMNPFYYKRKPKDQRGSSLNYVSDLFVMGGSLIVECNALLKWCEGQGYGPLALHGISMGGYTASLCASVWPKPISVIPCLSWTSSSVVFTRGILSHAVDWSVLTKQYFSDTVYSDLIRSQIQPPIPPQFQEFDEINQTNALSSISTNEKSFPLTFITNDYPPKADSQPSSNQSLDIGSKPTDDILSIPLPSQMDSNVHIANPSNVMDRHQTMRICLANSNSKDNNTKVDVQTPNDITFHKQTISERLSINQFSNNLPLLNLNSLLRYPLDSPLWHNSVSFIRSIPDKFPSSNSEPDPEVRQFLHDLLDYFTHLGNFTPVIDSRLVLAIMAENDAYVPRQGVCPLTKIYPECEIRQLQQSGHVGAYLRNAIYKKDFRKAITDCLNRQVELYHHEDGPFGHHKPK